MAVLNPKNAPYNAKGDGVADDQVALQNCFNDAKAGGHSVLIPAGKYMHSGLLIMNGISVSGVNAKDADGPVTWLYATNIQYRAVTFRGTAPNSLTKCKVSGTQTGRQIPNVGAPKEGATILADTDTANFTITHCWIEGTNTATTAPNVAGIFCYYANHGYIARNTLKNTVADAIHVTGNRSAFITIEYNYIEHSGDDGTAFVTYSPTAPWVNNCISRYNAVLNNGWGRGCTAVGSSNCQIVGNYITGGHNNAAGIMIASEPGYTSGGNWDLLVQDNTLVDCGGTTVADPVSGSATGHGAIHMYNAEGPNTNARRVTLQGNQLYKSRRDHVIINGGDAGVNISFINNSFYANGTNATPIIYANPTTPGAGSVITGNTGNLPATPVPTFKALGGVTTNAQAAVNVGANTTWTINGAPPTDPLPAVSIQSASTVTEGQAVVLTVTKSGTGACSVSYATATGTASTADFTAIAATTLSFGASETTKTISVQTTSDSITESSETFTVVLSSPTGCTLGTSTSVVTITDLPVPVNPVPLPYQPITSFDITVNLNSVSTRSFVGATYSGKHLKIIPKTTQDTAAGLYFEDCASVTIIGGSFKPASRALNGSTDSGASLYFKECGAVYLEGTLVDNTSIAQGHAVLVHAGVALTNVTLQNCRLVNVAGSDTGVAGTVFSTGGPGTGKTGLVRIHNLTASTVTGTRGIYVPPGTGGGASYMGLSNVNLFRVGGLGGFGFYHFLNAGTDYNTLGFPINLDNVWGQMGAGQVIEAQGIWPNVGAGSNASFGAKFAAVRSPDPLNGNKVGATWPQMNDQGREWYGYIYEGAPVAGDFVPESRIGLSYVPGIDLVEVVTPDPVPNPPPQTLPETVSIITVPNLSKPVGWTNGGTGTVSIDPKTSAITITNTTAVKTYTRFIFQTTAGKRYWLTYDQSVDVTARQLGTVVGAGNLSALTASTSGDNKIEVIAQGTEIHAEFSRSTVGTSTVGSIIFQEVLDNRTTGRRLNGRNQTFSLNTLGAGIRTANYSWLIGGWVRFTYMPTAAVYLLDFGRTDPASTFGGAGRVRVVYDPLNTKLLASTCQSDGNNYRENSILTALQADKWYHICCFAGADADVRVMINKIQGQVSVGNIPPLDDTQICRTLSLGGRIGSTDFAPVTLSDWVWCSGSIPDMTFVNALADGTRPNAITGFQPTYHWPMVLTGTQELNISTYTRPEDVGTVAGTPLISSASPVQVMGLGYAGSAPADPNAGTPMDCIII
jgi:hypothetical protein